MQLIGRQSTALPGYIAERVSHESLSVVTHGRNYAATILITGTNGKTTTTLLMKTMLEAAGYQVVNNSSGSNLARGVLTSLLADKRHGSSTVLLLEVDEASMPQVALALSPTHIAVLNLFRDQLDRYGEVDTTRRLLASAIQVAPDAELILNADDPHVASLAIGVSNHASYFGLDVAGLKALPHDHASDVPVSPVTGAPLVYSQRYFGHVGKYSAKDKSFSRPKLTLTGRSIDSQSQEATKISVILQNKQHKLNTQLTGIYSAYNVIAAALIAHSMGIGMADIQTALSKKQAAFGRQEIISYHGAEVQFYLIKNPTGFNQVIQAHLSRSVHDPVLIVINDNFADGRDVSWLWDAAVEDAQLKGPIIVAGTRAYDMALRLEYAGKQCRVIESPIAALDEAVRLAGQDRALVLPTYTALLDLRKNLKLKLEHSL